MKSGGHTIHLSNREKVFFPDAGLTKGDVIDYYQRVADTMVPHMRRYGVSMERFPEGLSDEGFYNKNAPEHFPEWIPRVTIAKREGGSFDAPIVDSKAALIYLANQAVLTPHLYLSPTNDLEHPDKMIYDLDPPEGTRDFAKVREAALAIRGVMDELEMKSWVQTTGSKGFHVVISLRGDSNFDTVRAFARDVARLLVRRFEDRYTLEQRKKERGGKVYLDTIRNSYGATSVAPYAVRARPKAPVATPVEWGEVEGGASPRDWTIKDIPSRLERAGDPWSRIRLHRYSLTNRRDRLAEMLDDEQPAEEERK